MIEHFQFGAASLDLIKAQARLRHEEFIVKQKWRGPNAYAGMEWDAFDTETAHYLLHKDEAGAVQGCLRMLPTMHPYMVEVLWPDFVDGPCPKSPEIWEITRIIARTGPAHFELMTAYHEVMHAFGGRRALMFGREKDYRKGRGSAWIAYHPLGPLKPLPDDQTQNYVAFVTDPVTPAQVAAWRGGPPFTDLAGQAA